MKQIFFITIFSFFICLSTNLFSQTITGRIIDENGEALTGANVVIEGTMSVVISDLYGNFKIKSPEKDVTLKIIYLGYQDFEKKITITSDPYDLGEIRLQPKAFMSDEVVVKATRFGDFNPTANTEISGKQLIETSTMKDITQMLVLQPSVVATSEAGSGMGATTIRVRGIDQTRINVTIDGMPLNDPESQAVFWNNMPDFASSISSLQLTRGVGTSTNGSAAFGANLNILTNQLNSEPYAEIGFWAGSFKSFKEHLLAGTGLMNNGLAFDVRFSQLNSDGFIRNGYSNHTAFNITGSWRNAKNLVRTNIIYGKQKTGITWNGVDEAIYNNLLLPENYRRTYNASGMYWNENGDTCYYKDDSDNYKQTHYILSYSHFFTQKLNLNIAARYTRGDGYYEDYKLGRKFANYNITNPIINGIEVKKTDLIQQKWMGNNTYTGNFSLNYRNNRWQITGGGDFSYYQGEHFGDVLWMQYLDTTKFEWYRNQGNKMDANAFVKANVKIYKGLHIFGDLQYRFINYKMSGIDDDLSNLQLDTTYNFINPKVGIFYQINNSHQVYFSFANSHREPTRTNFKEANHYPDRRPKSEMLFDYELGYTYQSPKFAGNINLYYMDYFDQLIPTGELSGSGYDIMRNVDRSFRSGIELSLAYKPVKQIEVKGTATFSRNKILNFVTTFEGYDENWDEVTILKNLGNVDLAYSPNVLTSGIFSYQPIDNLYFRVISKYVGKQYFDNTQNEKRKLDPYWTSDFQIDYSIFPKKIVKEIQLKFQVNNFTNTKYANDAIGGTWYEQGVEKQWAAYFPQAGVNFMGGISVRF